MAMPSGRKRLLMDSRARMIVAAAVVGCVKQGTQGRQHGVSHITAERALTTLKDEGLIVPVIGKGYYVAGT